MRVPSIIAAAAAVFITGASAQAQTKYRADLVVDVTGTPAAKTDCGGGAHVYYIEVWPDHIHYYNAESNRKYDLAFSSPRELGKATPVVSVTDSSENGQTMVTLFGELGADGLPYLRTKNNKSPCTWRFQIR